MAEGTLTCRSCVRCDRRLVAHRRWRRLGDDVRARLLRLGYAEHTGRNLCGRCRLKLKQPFSRDHYRWHELAEEVEFMLESGFSVWDLAGKLGMKHNSLATAFTRARRKGLTTRKIPYDNGRAR